MTAMKRWTLALGIAAALSVAVAAQSDRTEQKVPFEVDKIATLTTTAGPVKVTSLKITNLGRGYSRGGLSLRSANPPSELSTTLRMAFDVQNPVEQEWDVTFTVEFMDKEGKVIDRATKMVRMGVGSGVTYDSVAEGEPRILSAAVPKEVGELLALMKPSGTK